MRIAYFTNYYPPVVNGVVRSVSFFSNCTIKSGTWNIHFRSGRCDHRSRAIHLQISQFKFTNDCRYSYCNPCLALFWAAGLPVVGVIACGTQDNVDHGKQGLLVDNSAETLATAFINLLKNQDRLEKFRFGALVKAKQFNMELLAREMVSFLICLKGHHQIYLIIKVDMFIIYLFKSVI